MTIESREMLMERLQRGELAAVPLRGSICVRLFRVSVGGIERLDGSFLSRLGRLDVCDELVLRTQLAGAY